MNDRKSNFAIICESRTISPPNNASGIAFEKVNLMIRSFGNPGLFLALVWLLVITPTAQGTPPAEARVSIVPIAVNSSGEVLFKTMTEGDYDANTSNWRSGNLELGLLVVSAKGVWEEVNVKFLGARLLPDLHVEPGRKGELEAIRKEYSDARELFRSPMYWDAPPLKWRPLLEKFGFSQKDEINPNSGRGEVEWTGNGIRFHNKVISVPMRQRTLFNNVSVKDFQGWEWGGEMKNKMASYGEGAIPIKCDFFARGVALFNNNWRERVNPLGWKEEYYLGAWFDVREGFFPIERKPHPFIPDPEDFSESHDEWDVSEGISGIILVPGMDFK